MDKQKTNVTIRNWDKMKKEAALTSVNKILREKMTNKNLTQEEEINILNNLSLVNKLNKRDKEDIIVRTIGVGDLALKKLKRELGR